MSDTLPAHMAALQAEAQELKALAKEQEQEKAELKAEIQTLRDRVDQLESDKETVMRTLVAQMRAIETTAALDTASERQKLAEESVTLAKQRWLHEKAKSLAMEQIKEERLQIEELIKTMKERTEELDAQQQRVEEIKDEKEQIIEGYMKEIKVLEDQKSDLLGTLEHLKGEVGRTTEELEKVRQVKLEIDEQVITLVNKKSELIKEIEELRQDKENHYKELEDFRLKKHLLERNTLQLQMAEKKYALAMSDLKTQQNEHSLAVKWHDVRQKELETDRNAHTLEVERFSQNVKLLNEKQEQFARDNEELAQKCNKVTVDFQKLNLEKQDLELQRALLEKERQLFKEKQNELLIEKAKVEENLAWLVKQKDCIDQKEASNTPNSCIPLYDIPQICLQDKTIKLLMIQFTDMVSAVGKESEVSSKQVTLLPCVLRSASSSLTRIVSESLDKADVKASKQVILVVFHNVTRHMSATVSLDRRCSALKEAGLYRKFRAVVNVMFWADSVYACDVNESAVQDIRAILFDED